jgi:hypothetical protein
MQKRDSRRFVLIGVLLLILTATFAVAQTDSDETSDDERTDAEQPAASQEEAGVVYTTDYLKERFGEKADAESDVAAEEDAVDEAEEAEVEAEATPGAFTNEDLKERFGADEEAVDEAEEAEVEAEATPGAFTNEDLKERFGADEDAAAETEEVAEEAEAEAAAEPEATTEPEAPAEPTEPALSPEERARLISEIDEELERLDKRLLALKNPLLAGTVQQTPEERTEETGLDNAERLRRTEEKIDELKATLEELRSESPPDE